ncbi:hypothetical protein [Heliorestis acidaminivorans]|nr:hypothetical protein [Heliorestis acidaminivorans]
MAKGKKSLSKVTPQIATPFEQELAEGLNPDDFPEKNQSQRAKPGGG